MGKGKGKGGKGTGRGKGKPTRTEPKFSEVNPFEERNNKKTKHEVLNRRIKGSTRNVAKAREVATERRMKTLLVEHKQRNSANTMMDRRFGEGDASMSIEERMHERFKRERVKRSKGGMFSLNDDVEELTHGGHALSSLDFGAKDTSLEEDEEDGGQMDSAFVNEMHFGGFERTKNENAPKSKKEALEEMIARSKEHKKERQQTKAQQEDGVSKLDDEYNELTALLDFRDKTNVEKPKLDEYEKEVKALAFESRSKPADRVKTDLEIATEQFNKLESLEKKRLARMAGEAGDSSEDETDKRRKRKPASDDALEGNGIIMQSDSESDSESDSDVGSDEEDDESDEEREDVEDKEEEEEVDDDFAEDKGVDMPPPKRSKYEVMPYVLPCPRDILSLNEMVQSYCKTSENVVELITRIRQCTSIALDPTNRAKLHNFYDALLRRTVLLGEQANDQSLQEVDQICISIFEMSQELGGDSVLALWRRYLSECHAKLSRSLRHDAGQVAIMDSTGSSLALGSGWQVDGLWCQWGSAWPSRGIICLMAILGRVFPTSDFRHGVTTPASLLLGQCLAQCPVRSAVDVSNGVFTAATMLQYTELSKRVAPEAIEFLRSTLFLCASTSCDKSTQTVELARLVPTFASCSPLSIWLRACLRHKTTTKASDNIAPLMLRAPPQPQPVVLSMIEQMLTPSSDPNKQPPAFRKLTAAVDENEVSFARSLLGTCLKLVLKSVHTLANSLAFIELFEHIYVAILMIQVSPADEALNGLQTKVREDIHSGMEKCANSRTALNWQTVTKAESAVKSLAPRIDESYSGIKRSLGVKEEERRLSKAVKKEEKGAARELKRDSQFLSRVREDEREAIKSDAKAGRMKNFGWMEEQQATLNLQVRKGRGLAGGGSSIKKSVAAVLKSGKRQS